MRESKIKTAIDVKRILNAFLSKDSLKSDCRFKLETVLKESRLRETSTLVVNSSAGDKALSSICRTHNGRTREPFVDLCGAPSNFIPLQNRTQSQEQYILETCLIDHNYELS